ncbi:MAG: DUF4336 domain-containing protein [Calothrix sp. MO_192.B10]|nr:DUF4336 domain-containing protein [Calothrix sp. MO_192.B10]
MADDGQVVNTQTTNPQDFSWRFWFTLPIYPFSRRRTIRQEVVRDTIWTFDQLQGIFYVVVPIRMTVVKLDAGGLLVYAPIAPTKECIRLLEELVAVHGDVKYIILPTISGLEHKVFVGPFARKFPQAQVFITPDQWSFPVDLPINWLGLPRKRTHILPPDSNQAPFGDEFDYATLGTIELGTGKFAEVGFFHRASRSLLVTDTIVSIPAEPPAIAQLDPYPLLFHARDKATDAIIDNRANRLKGWQRIALFAMYFRPSVLEIPRWGEVFRNAFQAPERSAKAYFGLYPFQWQPNWERSFHALRGDGRLFVAPILQALILNRAPRETLNWANRVAQWDFQRIIPCHLDSPITATPHEFRQAFCFLEAHNQSCTLPEEDFRVLRGIDAQLNQRGIVPPAKEKV